MTTAMAGYQVTPEQLAFWNTEGYLIAPALFTAAEVGEIKDNFDALAAASQPVEGYWVPDLSPASQQDPLLRYPRVMHPHRWETTGVAKRYMLDQRVHDVLVALYGEEPVATQSMFYFKPPGARGQAMHQDNFYLQVKPNSCIAAWTAIDTATPENGGLYVVPGTHTMEVVCPDTADAGESFTTHFVRAPDGKKAVPVKLNAGDTLFFNGSLVHGSPPNRSKTQWRRSFICHYMPKSAKHISHFYAPLLDFAGNVFTCDMSEEGGPCGKEFRPTFYGSYGKWQ